MTGVEVVVDPFLFALPTMGGPDRFREYIENLLQWSKSLRQRNACTSQRALHQLQLTEQYPSTEKIRNYLSRFSIDDISLPEVLNALRSLAEREPFLESITDIQDIVHEGTCVNPECCYQRLPTNVSAAWRDALVSVVAWCKSERVESPGVGAYGLGCSEISVSCTVTMVATSCDVFEIGTHVDALLQVQSTPPITPAPSWEEVANDPCRAIDFVYQAAYRSGQARPVLRPIKVGSTFLASVARLGGSTPVLRALYRRCMQAATRTIQDVSGAKLHPKRTSEAADAPQEKRACGDSLWRCMVTQQGAGYRLHYWELAAGGIELDEVMPESET